MSDAEGTDGGEEGEGDRFDPEAVAAEAGVELPDVPDWDDEYLDRVSDRLMFNYDLQKDRRVRGERFEMVGTMRVENRKQFFHPALNYANHEIREYVFARRAPRVTVAELERVVELGHELADDAEWLVADEEHYGTEFTFVAVVSELSDDVREFVASFSDRTLLKFGYYGHYEVNLAAVAPEAREVVASENADAAQAFAIWDDVQPSDERGLLGRIVDRLRG
ncbi:hypothetical protein [Halopelagius longus]|uniref:DUF8052 domain-containing protein n=1 Tax=Halopelagius longus TaxID=1236180 RepID=A0A1H1EUN2_9EURY|nr:hypothetical protein [Halopelagius longus]RDI71896.1 hypothetical protein DWB78_09275 [Halopelagius longus]SDQ92433.1 hypothetical protein SAMN05216278_3072 [Halopelagius longus]